MTKKASSSKPAKTPKGKQKVDETDERILRELQKYPAPRPLRFVADMAASFQASVVEVLAEKTAQAAQEFGAKAVLLSGGVSANNALRMAVRARVIAPVYTPPLILCTDNAAMIAAAGTYRYQAGLRAGWDLDIEPSLRLAQVSK